MVGGYEVKTAWGSGQGLAPTRICWLSWERGRWLKLGGALLLTTWWTLPPCLCTRRSPRLNTHLSSVQQWLILWPTPHVTSCLSLPHPLRLSQSLPPACPPSTPQDSHDRSPLVYWPSLSDNELFQGKAVPTLPHLSLPSPLRAETTSYSGLRPHPPPPTPGSPDLGCATLITLKKACWENTVQKTGLLPALVSNKQKVKESESHSVLLTLCDPMDYSVHGILQARRLEWVAFPFSRRTFPTQGLNQGLPHCRQILYQLSHQGSPRILEWVAYPFSSNLPNPGIKLMSPALQADSLPTELPGKTLTNKVIPKEAIGGWQCIKASECRKRWLLQSIARTGLFACLNRVKLLNYIFNKLFKLNN